MKTIYQSQFFDNFAAIQREDGLWNIIDKQGNFLFPNIWFSHIDAFYHGFAAVRREDFRWNIIDRQGNILSPNLWFDYTNVYINPLKALAKKEQYYFDKNYKPHKDILYK